jgi:glycosyltransferase involved in cell wall biosynthesis
VVCPGALFKPAAGWFDEERIAVFGLLRNYHARQMKKLLIIEAQMKRYRKPFYDFLHTALLEDGIQLQVAYSDPPPDDARKQDTCDLPAEYGLKVNGYWLWPNRILYQPLLRAITDCDAVIIDQGNRYLLNHLLLICSRLGIHRVAFWGHGDNRRVNRVPFSEWYRRVTLNWVNWWFAYTKGTARYLESQGIPAAKITTVQNSMDTREMRQQVMGFSKPDQDLLREQLGIPLSARVAIFCGTLDKQKNLPFLIESGRLIQERVADFHLILVGTGPEAETVERLSHGLSWIHCVGPKFGKDKAELMAISDVFVLPGAVGLAIVDAFAAGLPMLTARTEAHGPEIEYLEDGVNGLMSVPTTKAFAETVSSVLTERDYLVKLQAGANASAVQYSIENMVANFRVGIKSCLGLFSPRAGVLDTGLSET